MSFVAPAGTPVRLREILACLSLQGNASALANLHSILCRLSDSDACWSFSSGRAAMVSALAVMRRLAGNARDQVIVPAYTCYSVPAAVIRAGLRPVLCDIDPATLSIDVRRLGQLDFSRVLAVVTANLYGLPNALTEVEILARRKGAFLLDDAAQSLGARIDGRPVGGFGDVGLYSFDKGKNIPTMQGGALVSRNADFVREMSSYVGGMPPPSGTATLVHAIELVLYSQLLRPRLYDWVRRLPGLGLGRTVYDVDYPVTRFSGTLAKIAARLSLRLEAFNGARVGNAKRLNRALQDVPGVRLVEELAGAEPVYLRFPVLLDSAGRRDALLGAFEKAGIGATGSYPQALGDVPEVAAALGGSPGDFAEARRVARTIITIPTHAYCPPNLAQKVRDTILASAQ